MIWISIFCFLLGGIFASLVWAAKWSDYTNFTGTLASTDDFIFRDIDNTDLAATGTQMLLQWSKLQTELEAVGFGDFDTDGEICVGDGAAAPDCGVPVRTEFIPIEWSNAGANDPGSATTITSGSRKVDVIKFDGTDGEGDEDLELSWQVPDDIVTTNGIKFQVITFVTESTTPSSTGWAFFLQGCSIATSEGLGCTLGTAVESNSGDRSDAQYDIVYTTESSAVTITGLAAGELVLLKLYRDVSDSDDDYEQDVGVYGILIQYEYDLATPSL